ncbi:hypothetical protein N0V94_007408 [Neodidymelliopsis sp. IMI 364377]|nr:hypothetical protein N0V94_007408 [Neodidymelliopsis sp. IMI 364377]
MSKYDGLQELYVDRLLVAADNADAVAAQSPSMQDLDVFAYFEHIDPIHPFLEKQTFEDIALGSHLSEKLAKDKSWSALFYAVLALGSQYHDGGSYQPSKNGSWRVFATALAIFPDLLITRTTLNTVQALTAMAIFASNVSCLQIEYTMVSEGAKKAQTLGYNRSTAPGDDPRNRTFWVLYFLEKNMVLVGLPLAALLVLFDLVIDKPTHPETAANLALLDVGSGHFSGLEYASQGTLPGSIASEFTQIARTYVREKSATVTPHPVTPSEGPIPGAGVLDSNLPNVSSASGSDPELQHFSLGWDLQSESEAVPGTDMLNLFGSYFPLWDGDGTYNI